eukprot:6212326-Pleurochrysis_carterae.AAC.2
MGGRMASPILQNGRLFWRMVGTLLTQCEERTILQNGQGVLQNGQHHSAEYFIHDVQIWRTSHFQYVRVCLAMLFCRMYPRHSLIMQNSVYSPILQNGTS